MSAFDYDDICGIEETPLDCLSAEALVAEWLIEEMTGLHPVWDEEE
jgi:hypothetical protein